METTQSTLLLHRSCVPHEYQRVSAYLSCGYQGAVGMQCQTYDVICVPKEEPMKNQLFQSLKEDKHRPLFVVKSGMRMESACACERFISVIECIYV